MRKKKQIIGTCALCNIPSIKLTPEHILPGAKRNRANNFRFLAKINNSVISSSVNEIPTSMNLQELREKGLAHHQQGGVSIHSLCQKCNNNTGSWYGTSYIEWKNQWDQIINSHLKQNQKNIKGKITFNPLRFLKQIMSCFISIDYSDHRGKPLGGEHLREKQPKLFDFVLDPHKRYNFKNLRVFVHLLPENYGQGYYNAHITAYNHLQNKDVYPYTLNLIDGHIQYSLLFDTNSPYEPKYFGRQILDISKYGIYPDQQTVKNLKLEEINWIFKLQAQQKEN